MRRGGRETPIFDGLMADSLYSKQTMGPQGVWVLELVVGWFRLMMTSIEALAPPRLVGKRAPVIDLAKSIVLECRLSTQRRFLPTVQTRDSAHGRSNSIVLRWAPGLRRPGKFPRAFMFRRRYGAM